MLKTTSRGGLTRAAVSYYCENYARDLHELKLTQDCILHLLPTSMLFHVVRCKYAKIHVVSQSSPVNMQTLSLPVCNVSTFILRSLTVKVHPNLSWHLDERYPASETVDIRIFLRKQFNMRSIHHIHPALDLSSLTRCQSDNSRMTSLIQCRRERKPKFPAQDYAPTVRNVSLWTTSW